MNDQTKNDYDEVLAQSVPPPPILPTNGVSPQQTNNAARPTAATVIGIILIVSAGLTVLSLMVDVIRLHAETRNPMLSKDMILVSLCSGSVSAIVQLVMGIGLLRIAPWARKGTIISLVAIFIIGTVASIISLFLMPNSIMQTQSGIEKSTMIFGTAFGLFFTLAINSLMIYFLTRPNMVEAFDRAKR